MAEYIERGAACRAADLAMDLTEAEYDMICNQIDQIPAADVAPVVHGHFYDNDSVIDWLRETVCIDCPHSWFGDGSDDCETELFSCKKIIARFSKNGANDSATD